MKKKRIHSDGKLKGYLFGFFKKALFKLKIYILSTIGAAPNLNMSQFTMYKVKHNVTSRCTMSDCSIRQRFFVLLQNTAQIPHSVLLICSDHFTPRHLWCFSLSLTGSLHPSACSACDSSFLRVLFDIVPASLPGHVVIMCAASSSEICSAIQRNTNWSLCIDSGSVEADV